MANNIKYDEINFNDHFEPEVTGYSPGNAYCLGVAAELAYEEESVVRKVTKKWNFKETKFYDHRGTQAFLAADDDKIIVAFRGTEPSKLADWFTDFDANLVPGPVGEVHDGFYSALNLVWDEISEQIDSLRQRKTFDLSDPPSDSPPGASDQDKVPTLWFTGHSLGAALANLAATEMKFGTQDRPVRGLYTYGQPRVGDTEFARAFNAEFGGRVFRHVNNNDIVTRVAPRSLGYSHVGSLRYFDVKGNIHDNIDWWDRFLDRIKGRMEDFLGVFKGDLPFDGIEDHNMVEGYIPNLKALA